MKTTITGTSGFVHQNLSKYLENHNHQIHSLSLRNSDWKNNFDPSSNAIIHLAGKAHDTKNTADASEYFAINTELTKQLFDVFLQSDVQDFFYFSSVKAAADEVKTILNEVEIPNPKTPYGQSKLQAENYILSKEIPDGKRVFIIRPCMIHGPGNKGNLNLFYKIVQKGIPYPLAAFENNRSFLGIDNLNFLIHQMLDNKNVGSGIYNFADDEPLSTNNLFKLIAEVLGQKPKLLKISKPLISFIAKIGDKIKLPLNSEKLQKLTENYVVCNKKIKSKLNISKLPNSVADGLTITIKSFKK